jgi:beta-phosphoglucomutase-like phosphatase (HAD superfamily)
MRSWGATWTEEDAVSSRGTGIPETAKRMAERAGREFDPVVDPARLIDAFFELCGSVREKKGARTLAERAISANVPTAVASSSPARVVEKILDATKLRPLFGAIVTGDDVTKKKPDPAIFQLAAERAGVRPRTCLVFEDSMPGVLGAKNAAMAVIAVPEVDAHTFEGVADAVAKDLDEAASWLEF